MSAAPARPRILKAVRQIAQRLVREHAGTEGCTGASWEWETPRGHWCPAALVILSTGDSHRKIRIRTSRASNGEVFISQEGLS